MRTALIALLAGAATVTPHAAAPEATPANTPGVNAAPATLPPFAAELAQLPMITGASSWHGETGDAGWALLAASRPDNRQLRRWNYALGLIGEGRGADALGVLDVMQTSDRDLGLVAPFLLARGVALTLVERDEDAVSALAAADLAVNPEACAWRMRALAHAGDPQAAVRQVNCALPAINGRSPEARTPFVLAAAAAAIDAGQPRPALAWLNLFSDHNPQANVLRGRALLVAGDPQAGKLRLERAALAGGIEIKAQAKLGTIEAGLALHNLAPAEALKQLDALRFGWRGGAIEQRALEIQLRVANEAHDLRGQLRAGAALIRYFKLGMKAAPMLAELQAALSAALAPDSGVALPEAAGLYWDYRELAPAGAEGDALVLRLAIRLQDASLYARAAELLQYQLTQRAQDVAQGPLSVKVAALHILSGRPDRALDAIRTTEQPSYSDAMRYDRKRVEAVALLRLGKMDAAMAALDGLPDAHTIRAEMHWQVKDWGSFVTENTLSAPRGVLSEPAQAAILRQAVALAMLGREDQLELLRTRYAAAFKALPSGQAFDVLTRDVGSIDPAAIGAAMAAIPQASPAGSTGDLLDAAS
ncbi:hypothetical protein [Sphingomonas psychrotolerans]|uniref:Tetratricopeptide repeat protein n=1 Tax=Sphingomonas psychrotolerans TaxID=1327635 RepID=A0A2K8MDW8_9SPHN|nr:hypothetical protein [Sphingomonas psychrotolerans]ATY32088.1 hypothetical protein CVN68_08950 [Sphingomonas psychrotolerans]